MTRCPACGHRLARTAPAPSTEAPSWLRDAPPSAGEQGPRALHPDQHSDADQDSDADQHSDPDPADVDSSVRPPTVDRDDLPEPDRDPLAGWDRDPAPGVAPDVADWKVVTTAAATGLVVGLLVAPRGRSLAGAVSGALVGLAGAGAARSVWRIDPPDGSWARQVTG